MDNYTFTGTAGDWILGRVGSVPLSPGAYGRKIAPVVKVYGPSGTLLGTYTQTHPSSYSYYSPEFLLHLTEAGTYTMLVTDDDGQSTGDYGVYVQRMNNPSNPVTITYGTTLAGSIVLPAEFDTYTFAATQGDLIYARLTSGFSYGNEADLRLFAPNGTCLAFPHSGSPLELTLTAPATGTYTLLAGDAFGSYTGNYGIVIQRQVAPHQAVALEFGRAVNGTISVVGETDAYTFTGTAGDWILGRVGSVPLYPTGYSPKIAPVIKVYGPSGTLLGTYTQTHPSSYSYYRG